MEGTPGGKCAELRKGYILRVVSLQILSNLSDDKILPAYLHTQPPLLDVCRGEMLDDRQQERLAIHRRRTFRNCPMQPQKSRE